MQTPREVFDQSCAQIAAHLLTLGFEYSASRHSAFNMSADLKFEIHFQSSSKNYLVNDANGIKWALSKIPLIGDLATFGNVVLIEHANVSSKKMKAFRRSLAGARRSDGAVTGGQIGNLRTPSSWVQFNLANPHTRLSVIEDAKKLIDSVAIPYFKLFDQPEKVMGSLVDGSMPWTWEPNALEYACCFGDKERAIGFSTVLFQNSRAVMITLTLCRTIRRVGFQMRGTLMRQVDWLKQQSFSVWNSALRRRASSRNQAYCPYCPTFSEI